MSATLDLRSSTLSTTGFEDGLGRRSIRFDREVGGMLEGLHVRPGLALFESGLRHTAAAVAALEDERFARAHAFERDPNGLVVVSELPAGERLADILESRGTDVGGLDAAIGLLLQTLPALSALHAAGVTHGTVAPGRMLITTSSLVLLLDAIYASALERLRLSRQELWTSLGILVPATAGGVRFTPAMDVAQVSLAALSLAVGRTVRADTPAHLNPLIAEASDVAQIRRGDRFAAAVRRFFELTLPSFTRSGGISAEAAATEIERIARQIGHEAALEALGELVRAEPMAAPTAEAEATSDSRYESETASIAAPEPATESIAAPAPEPMSEPIAAPAFDPVVETAGVPLGPPTPEPVAAVAEPGIPPARMEAAVSVPAPISIQASVPVRPLVFVEPPTPLQPPVPTPPPVVLQPPVAVQPPVPVPPPVPQPVTMPRPVPLGPTAVPIAPVIAAATPPPATPLRLKADGPPGYAPPKKTEPLGDARASARTIPGVHRVPQDATRPRFRGTLAAAAVLVIVAGTAAARDYLEGRGIPAPAPLAPPLAGAAAVPPTAAATGSLAIQSQPEGARVSLNGDDVGLTPLTIDSVPPGRHVVTFTTDSVTIRRTVRIEAGKQVSLDVPVYSGWIVVFAPIRVLVSTGARTLGTSESGRIMMSPGRHSITFSNPDFGYSATEIVDIKPGEERAFNLQPTGIVNVNAHPWAEVWVDGRRMGETPVANLAVTLGTREFVFRHPQYGERKLITTVTTTASALSIDFTTPDRQP